MTFQNTTTKKAAQGLLLRIEPTIKLKRLGLQPATRLLQ